MLTPTTPQLQTRLCYFCAKMQTDWGVILKPKLTMNKAIYKTDNICHWYKFLNGKCLQVTITCDGAALNDISFLGNHYMKEQDSNETEFNEKLEQVFNHLISL